MEAAASDYVSEDGNDLTLLYNDLIQVYTDEEIDAVVSLLMVGGETKTDSLSQMLVYDEETVRELLSYIDAYTEDGIFEALDFMDSLEGYADGQTLSYVTSNTGSIGYYVDMLVLKGKLDSVMGSIITDGMTEYEKVYAIAEWIAENVDYNTYATGAVYGPMSIYGAAVEGNAICYGYAGLFMTMCAYEGVETRRLSGYLHAFNVVKVDGEWYFADPTYFKNTMGTYSESDIFLYGLDSERAICPAKHFIARSGYEDYYNLVTGNGYYYEHSSCNGSHNFKYLGEDEASCKDGCIVYICLDCGCIHCERVDAVCEHSWNDGVYTEPTCSTDGYTTYTCTTCRWGYAATKVVVDEGSATGNHDYVETVTKAATCEADGIMTYTCSVCGDTYTEAIEATGHSYTSKVTTAPTATTDGVRTYTCANCGKTYTETIAATGDYIDISECTVTLSETSSVYDGKRKDTSITATVYNGSTLLTGGTDYTWGTSSSITKPGTYAFTFTGKGNYTGTTYAYYTVKKADQSLVLDTDSLTLAVGETATITAVTTAAVAGNTSKTTFLSSDTSVASVGTPTQKTSSSAGTRTASVTVTAIEEGTATITVTSPDNDYYNGVSRTITVTVEQPERMDISGATLALDASTYTYDGTAKKPGVTVTLDGNTLVQGTDYSVSYYNNTDAGTATVTISGEGDYIGTVAGTFTIDKAPQVVAIAGTLEYTIGGTLSLSAAHTGDGTLTWDYGGADTAATSGPAGEYTVTVTASETDNYLAASASVVVTVSEAPAEAVDISGATVTLGTDSYTYDGTAKTPSVTVTLDGATLVSGTDYTVKYTGNTAAGTAVVAVTGCGNYCGTATKTFQINKASQSITLGSASAVVNVGNTASISATASAGGALSYESSNTSVAAVSSDGTITGVSAGSATILVTAAATANYEVATATVSVTVSRVAQTLTVTPSSVSIAAGGTQALAVDGAKTTLTYSSSNASVATVSSSGVITGVAAGTATITVSAAQTGTYAAATKSVTVTVSRNAQSIKVGASSVSLKAGATSTISVSGAKTALGYVSSNTAVATVNSTGKITAVSAGTATITVTAAQTGAYASATATVSVTVTRNSQSLTVNPASVSIAVGKTQVLAVDNAKTTLSYSSSNTSVATVSSTGTITAKAVGTATITVTAAQTGTYAKATKTVTITVIPAAPTLSSVKNTTSGVKVTWKKVTGATGYYVYRKVSGGSYSKVKTITSGSTVSWTDTTAANGKTYSYKVKAYASTGASAYSSAKSIRCITAGKVSSLTNGSTGITVKWAKVSGVTGYYVYRKTSGGSYAKVKTITGASTVSWTDTAVKSKNGTTYYYYVKPYYTSGSTTYTGSYTAVKTVRLTAVSLSSVKNSASKKITAAWAKNSKASGYQVQYSTNSSFSDSKTVTVSGASTLSKTISSLTKGKTYYVRVRAYKTVSGTKYYSAWSSKKSVKVSK